MHKQTYKDSSYTLYQYSSKPPELKYPDFTLSLAPKGAIHLTTQSKEFNSVPGLSDTIEYWRNSHYEYSNTLMGLEIANAISEVMLYSGLASIDFMTLPYYDFINASLEYFIQVPLYSLTNILKKYYHFRRDYYSNKYLRPYITENIGQPIYTNTLSHLCFEIESDGLPFFCKRDKDYFMSLQLDKEGFIEIPIPKQVVEKTNNVIKLRSFYRTLCDLLYYSGYHLMNGVHYSIADKYKVSFETLLQKVKSYLKEVI